MISDVTRLPQRTRETIGWIDALRVIAAFMVVFSHSCDSFVAQFDNDFSTFLTGVMAGSLMRPAVPLFVMMTGVLLLPIPSATTMRDFYRKRIGRILRPLVFWSLALPVAFWLYFTTAGAASANPMLSPADYNGASLLIKLYTWIFNFNFDTVPLWYLYMLIGLYLIMPVLGAWLDKASRSEVALFLKIWGVSLLIPYLQMLAPLLGYEGNWGNMGILGVCDWNVYGSFYYISGFIGYLVLAYYLSRWPLRWSWNRTLAICLPMFALGYAITAGCYLWFQTMFPGNYAYLEIVWLFCGVNVFMMTFPVFVIVQKLDARSAPWLTRLASLSFGVYLCHFVFVYIFFDLINPFPLHTIVKIVLIAIATFALSALIARIFSAVRPLRRFIA